jgi:hypothetical protein
VGERQRDTEREKERERDRHREREREREDRAQVKMSFVFGKESRRGRALLSLCTSRPRNHGPLKLIDPIPLLFVIHFLKVFCSPPPLSPLPPFSACKMARERCQLEGRALQKLSFCSSGPRQINAVVAGVNGMANVLLNILFCGRNMKSNRATVSATSNLCHQTFVRNPVCP